MWVGVRDGMTEANKNNKIWSPVRDRDDRILVDNLFCPESKKYDLKKGGKFVVSVRSAPGLSNTSIPMTSPPGPASSSISSYHLWPKSSLYIPLKELNALLCVNK